MVMYLLGVPTKLVLSAKSTDTTDTAATCLKSMLASRLQKILSHNAVLAPLWVKCTQHGASGQTCVLRAYDRLKQTINAEYT